MPEERQNKGIGVFLDLDGCWADTEPCHWSAWRDALVSYGIGLTWETYQKDCVGHSDWEILEHYVSKIDHAMLPQDPKEILIRKLQLFVDTAKSKSFVPQQNIDLIKKLRRFPVALITSSTQKEVDAVLYPIGIKNLFTTMVTLDDVRHPKPDPEPYLTAKGRLNVTEGFAFEDSETGLRSATAAGGLTVIKVPGPLDLAELVKIALNL